MWEEGNEVPDGSGISSTKSGFSIYGLSRKNKGLIINSDIITVTVSAVIMDIPLKRYFFVNIRILSECLKKKMYFCKLNLFYKVIMKNTNKNTAVLLLHCPDKQGIIAAVTEFININKGNIIYLDQHVDKAEKIFFMRVEWELDNFLIPTDKINEYFQTLLANKYEMEFQIHFHFLSVFLFNNCIYKNKVCGRNHEKTWFLPLKYYISLFSI